MPTTLITCYVSPDLDGVAGAVAYGEYLRKTGKDVVVGIMGEMQEEARYVFDRFGIQHPQQIQNADNFDKVILVDASDLTGLEGNVDAEKVIEIIDHRKVNDAHKFPNAKVQIEFVGAAATLVAEKFLQNNIDISKESAILIYSAIISNTLNFKGSVTTDRDIKVATWLNTVALLHDDYWKELFIAKSDLSGNKLINRIKDDFAWFDIGGKKISIAQIEMIGAEKLLVDRCDEMIEVIESIKQEMSFDHIFLNLIELDGTRSYIVAKDEETRQLLEKALSAKFTDNVAKLSYPIMRKQIVPLL